jgi:hypothetical protein
VAVFGSYKQHVLKGEQKLFEKFSCNIPKCEFIEMILSERRKAMTPENISAGFRAAAIAPFDSGFLSMIPESRKKAAAQNDGQLITNSAEWIFQAFLQSSQKLDLDI